MNRAGLLIAGLLVLSVIVFLALPVLVPQETEYAPADLEPQLLPRGTSPDGSAPSARHALLEGGARTDERAKMSIEDRLVEQLRQFYGDTIAEKSTQAMLLNVRDHVRKLFPEDGDARFYDILKRAFPEYADEIMNTLAKLDAYNRWVKENKSKLAEMAELERKGALWEKRRELFDDEVEEVWSEEVTAHENRQKTMKETMERLDESHDTSIEEKLDDYVQTLNDTYENSPEAYFLHNIGLLAKVFFGIESVNQELAAMAPEERQEQINAVRRELGFTDEQIEEHEKMDNYRNRRWERGLAYMEERDSLATQFQGAELEEKLTQLREEYFAHEAKTIELEEKDGFFRYQRERVYGRN